MTRSVGVASVGRRASTEHGGVVPVKVRELYHRGVPTAYPDET